MKITLLNMGKISDSYLKEGIEKYFGRLKHYTQIEIHDLELPAKWQKLPPLELKKKEADLQLKWIEKADCVVLLDESGRQFGSLEFSTFIQQKQLQSIRHLMFVSGGSWGFDTTIYEKAHLKISLSKMTFPHHLVRLIFLEQLYRAFTLLRNEPYHNA
ncbi:MAG TPA: 23S rRNA (pseudouridine(1915)-N(3))-methyltransferase RlmH [Bacteroidales bacterium]|nr:23S rRNA (pseudouridine(1915)-N(3))-methyltransferase RlmH [Bacteroidales bacterium]